MYEQCFRQKGEVISIFKHRAKCLFFLSLQIRQHNAYTNLKILFPECCLSLTSLCKFIIPCCLQPPVFTLSLFTCLLIFNNHFNCIINVKFVMYFSVSFFVWSYVCIQLRGLKVSFLSFLIFSFLLFPCPRLTPILIVVMVQMIFHVYLSKGTELYSPTAVL